MDYQTIYVVKEASVIINNQSYNLLMEGNNSHLLQVANVEKNVPAGPIREEMIMDEFQDKGFGIDQSLHLEFSQS